MDGDSGGHEPRRVSRRALVVAAAVGGGSLLTGCGLRLDLPPDPAPAPTRRPAPDEAYLLAVVADLDEIVADERRLVGTGRAGRVPTTLLALHERQRSVLVGRLTNAGVPTAVIPTAPATGAVRTPATAATLAGRLADLTATDWSDLAAASEPTRELVAAAYGMRLAGAALLGHPVGVAATSSPARPALVARTAPLVYAFEVVAAQSTGTVRERALTSLTVLRRLLHDVTRGPGGSAATGGLPGGWALPFPVTTSEQAGRLATETLSTAVDAGTDAAGRRPSGPTLEEVARWSARVQALATTWGVPLTAFPGTTS